ncbi:MAG: hypothetical protein NPIRA04_13780 [Nitrospirales bacterium]|nr:MAG: hypothetical protein NPIRA04_13780 [Nitrospirales bacterium]
MNATQHDKPLVVLLYELSNTGKELVSYSIYYKSDGFWFIRPPGRYLLVAFEDTNEDLAYQKTEYAGYYGTPSVITVEAGKDLINLDINLQPPWLLTLNESPDLSSPATVMNLTLPKIQFGEVVRLEDTRFSQETGQIGLWEPIRFLYEIGGGLYFLEPYDHAKTPVLFIHGAGGSPQDWTYLINHLDRSRFQPWVFHYPSGIRLEQAAELLRHSLSEIYVSHKVTRFIVIAHSMGGLVFRFLINHIGPRDDAHVLKLFVTLSTPWAGHQAAQLGVDHAPAVIPSWLDMVPNSPFQRSVFQYPMPEYIDYYLLFSLKGRPDSFTPENNDGTVSLKSQLQMEAQKEAKKIWGFNEDHRSVLQSPDVANTLNEILQQY